MAKVDKKKVSRIKTKKKVWYKVLAPKIFGEKSIGESYLSNPESAVGRTLKVNLRELSGNVKDQNIYVSFRVASVDGTTLKTSPIGSELTSAFVKRLVRKNCNRLDTFTTITTKNGDEVLLKGLILTLNQTYRSTQAAIRKKFNEVMKEEAAKVDFSAFLSQIVSYRLQSGVKKKLSKLYPVKEATVRVLKLKKEAEKAKEIAKEKTKETVQEIAKEKTKEPAKEKVEEPTKEPSKEPTKEPTKEKKE